MANRKKRALILLGALAAGMAPAPSSAVPSRRMEHVMGTVLEIEADSEDPSGAERALEGAFAEVRRLDRLLSNWREDSEISRLNRSAYPESSATPREVAGVLRRAKA